MPRALDKRILQGILGFRSMGYSGMLVAIKSITSLFNNNFCYLDFILPSQVTGV